MCKQCLSPGRVGGLCRGTRFGADSSSAGHPAPWFIRSPSAQTLRPAAPLLVGEGVGGEVYQHPGTVVGVGVVTGVGAQVGVTVAVTGVAVGGGLPLT